MTTRWLIRNWFRVGRKISWKLSFYTLFSLLYFIPAFRTNRIYRLIEAKNKFILSRLEESYLFLIDKYKSIPNKNTNNVLPNERNIWVMWWQGEQEAPPIVRMCINSIRKNSNGAKVTVITKYNYTDYISIPDYIIEKQEAGYISFAHLADIMRVFLIAEHGGLWLDSTIYVSKPIPDYIFAKSFYSLHSIHSKTPFVADDRFYTFVLGGTTASNLFMFEKDFFAEYCKENDVMIDYYLLDYSIMLQYFNIPQIKEEIDNLEVTSESLYSLVDMLNEPYDEIKMQKALDENLFSKLRWNGVHKEFCHGKKTAYSVLLDINGVNSENGSH